MPIEKYSYIAPVRILSVMVHGKRLVMTLVDAAGVRLHRSVGLSPEVDDFVRGWTEKILVSFSNR